MTETRLPVTLLTGFLGSGKSTLLNKILSHDSTDRIAVIVNEFGAVGLDHDLIEATDEEVVLMASGCLCCSIRGDLSQTLTNLLDRREQGELAFDRVVIETTGLADPAPIRQTLLVDYALVTTTVLDGVVTLVDAANGQNTLDTQFEAVSQTATADLLVLSKTDLVSDAEIETLATRLKDINPTAQIINVTEVATDPQMIFGLSGIRRGATGPQALAWMTRQDLRPVTTDPFANISGFSKTPPRPVFSPHDARIQSGSITLDTPVDDEVFDHWLDTLVALKGPNLLRVKGIVFLKGIEPPFVFHGVQHIFDRPEPLANWYPGNTTTRVVVIARDMTKAEIERSLDMLRATKSSVPQPKVFPGWDAVAPDSIT